MTTTVRFCDTVANLDDRRQGRTTVVGDGTELTVGEAARRLGVSDTTVRSYITQGLLHARWTVGGHARIDTASVDTLAEVLRIPPGSDRDTALGRLRRGDQR